MRRKKERAKARDRFFITIFNLTNFNKLREV
jgi:hypothetical protein